MSDMSPTSPGQDAGTPDWLNSATIKGALLVGLGLIFLLAPDLSVRVLRFVIGGALVFFGASELWAYLTGRDRSKSRSRLLSAIVAVGAGLGLMLWPSETRRIIEIVLGVWLILQGLIIVGRAYSVRDSERILSIVRGIVYGGVGVAMFFAGDFILDLFIVFGAVLALAAGLIMIGYGIGDHSREEVEALDALGMVAIVGAWLDDRELGDAKRLEVAETLYFEEPDLVHKITSYAVMLLLSVSIATLAILQDSTAVVIGAMLIAPLMTPIMGTAAAIVNGWRGRMLSSLTLVAISVVAAIGVAFIIATWIPALVPIASNSQVASRVSPTLLDMAIALAAGAAGAYATVDDRVSSSLPGVAIAVALVPPLGVVGVTLYAGSGDDAIGAFLLFLTNFVSIILASVFVFFLTGFSPVRRFIDQRSDVINVLGTVIVGALLIMVPLGLTGASIINTATNQQKVQQEAEAWIAGSAGLELGTVGLDGSEVAINVSGTGALPSVQDLENSLSESLGKPITVEVEYFETVRITYSDEAGLEVSEPSGTPAGGEP
jgi:uncharacterized hydrophobic protein (TIGR00271 family)